MGKVWHDGEWWDETAWNQYACDHEDGPRSVSPEPEFTAPPTTPLRVPMNLSAVVAAMSDRLREMVGANIALQLNLEPELWVKMDKEEMPVSVTARRLIEEVVLNLITNARDAMPQGGTLTVETSRVNVGPDLIRRKVSESSFVDEVARASEGNYVRLLVRDNGMGMDAHTKGMCFEPFWTTKAVGKGQGLGLSVVYGIVRASGGWMAGESELGRGTSVEVYLPEVAAPVGQPHEGTDSL